MSRPVLVTAALPYANGPLHFGHVAGAYLPADIYARYLRLRGRDVVFVCGTDEHGVAITMKAEAEGRSYQEYVDGWHEVIAGFFRQLDISFDVFSQTSRRDPHYPLSQEFFLRLLEGGKVAPRTTRQHYCPRCARYLPDRFVEGTCYLCQAPRARGDECKACGSWLEAVRLIDPVCSQCGQTPELRDTTQYELQLTGFEKDPAIQGWYDRFAHSQKPNVKTFVVDKMVEGEGLRPRPITRDLPWGVPVPSQDLRGQPLTGTAGKVLYVWFDAPIGYISATIEWARAQGDPDLWRRYWIRKEGEEGARLVHFIGKDNIPFHCIVFPSMLAWQSLPEASGQVVRDAEGNLRLAPVGGGDDGGEPAWGPGPGEHFVLPEAVPANEFYNLEGRKFNTSDGWYIDLAHVFQTTTVDQLRYYLAASMPETSDSNFYWEDFQAKTNELADTFGNLASRVVGFVHKYREGRVPDLGDPASSRLYQPVCEAIRGQRAAFCEALDRYQFRAGLAAMLDLCRYGNKLLDEEKPWAARKTDPGRCDEALFFGLFLLKALVPMTAPFLPQAAAGLAAMLAWEEPAAALEAPAEPLPGGHLLGDSRVLIPKVDDERVQAEQRRLRGEAPEAPEAPEAAGGEA